MRFFMCAVEVCVTGIQRYDYSFNQNDTSKQLVFKRDFKNKFDKNAIKVYLDDKHIGYIKRDEAQLLSPVMKTNSFYVKKWGVESHTDGYMIVHCILREKSRQS